MITVVETPLVAKVETKWTRVCVGFSFKTLFVCACYHISVQLLNMLRNNDYSVVERNFWHIMYSIRFMYCVFVVYSDIRCTQNWK